MKHVLTVCVICNIRGVCLYVCMYCAVLYRQSCFYCKYCTHPIASWMLHVTLATAYIVTWKSNMALYCVYTVRQEKALTRSTGTASGILTYTEPLPSHDFKHMLFPRLVLIQGSPFPCYVRFDSYTRTVRNRRTGPADKKQEEKEEEKPQGRMCFATPCIYIPSSSSARQSEIYCLCKSS